MAKKMCFENKNESKSKLSTKEHLDDVCASLRMWKEKILQKRCQTNIATKKKLQPFHLHVENGSSNSSNTTMKYK